jgi:hypothetical protein
MCKKQVPTNAPVNTASKIIIITAIHSNQRAKPQSLGCACTPIEGQFQGSQLDFSLLAYISDCG